MSAGLIRESMFNSVRWRSFCAGCFDRRAELKRAWFSVLGKVNDYRLPLMELTESELVVEIEDDPASPEGYAGQAR
jgi:hypothetical protein